MINAEFERLKSGKQMRDFAVRCAACRSAEEEEKKEEEEREPESGESGTREEEREPESGDSGTGEDEPPKKEEEEEKRMVAEGYACTFGAPYQLWRGGGVAVFERIDASAFDGAEMRDVVLQYDHAGRVYARQSNGTLSLALDARGLKVRADLSGTEEGRKLFEEIRGGYTTKMSFSFSIEESEFEEKSEEEVLGFRTGCGDRYFLHDIRKIGRVYDVSAVSIPANEGTEIAARKRTDCALCAVSKDGERARLALAVDIEMAASHL